MAEKGFIWKSNDKSLCNCNRKFRDQPSGWISWLLFLCTFCTNWEPIICQLDKKRSYIPDNHTSIYLSVYSIGLGFHTSETPFSVHDNGVVRHHLSHLNTRYEQHINQHLIDRHRVYRCINYMSLYCFI